MTRIMRADRTVVGVDDSIAPAIHAQMLRDGGFVKASDGLWLPKCDLAQYERGERQPIEECPLCGKGLYEGGDVHAECALREQAIADAR